jgi:serine/threonine protein kinase/formylglycine-generating enzyme required for sulfatase activity
MPTEDELMFAKIVLLQQYCSKEHLAEAFEVQKTDEPRRPVEDILFEKGYLTDDQIQEIRKVQEKYLEKTDGGSIKPQKGAQFGKLAASESNVSKADVADAMAEQERRKQDGSSHRLGEIMHEKGLLDTGKVEEILAKQNKKLLKCPACDSQFNVAAYDPNKEYACAKCGGILKIPESISNVHAEETIAVAATIDVPHRSPIKTPSPNAPPPAPDAGMEPGQDKFIGREIGGCLILEKIGEGGMGAVYKGKHLALDKVIAVKIMLLSMTSEEQKKRFFREARSAAKLDHPNIVQVLNVGEEGGYYYIVMQFITGTSVGNILKTAGAIELERATKIIRDTALALKEAHDRHIIHRDIKPDNISVTTDGVTKVLDFGLARDVESVGEVTRTGQILGTPFFMAPEQFSGAKIDNRADIYALGITYYYMITGQKPFVGNTPFEVMMAHINQPLKPAKEIVQHLPDEIDQVIAKMTAKSPEERYEDMSQVIGDLNAVLARYSSATMVTPGGMTPTPSLLAAQKPPTSTMTLQGAGAAAAAKKGFPAVPVIIAAVVVVIAVVAILAFSGGGTQTPSTGEGENSVQSAEIEQLYKDQISKAKNYLRNLQYKSAQTELGTIIENCKIEALKNQAKGLRDNLAQTISTDFSQILKETGDLEKEKKYSEAKDRLRPFLDPVVGTIDVRTFNSAQKEDARLKKIIESATGPSETEQMDEAKRLREKGQLNLALDGFRKLTASKDSKIAAEAATLAQQVEAELATSEEKKAREEYAEAKKNADKLIARGDFDQAANFIGPFLASKFDSVKTEADKFAQEIKQKKAAAGLAVQVEQAAKDLSSAKALLDAGDLAEARRILIKLKTEAPQSLQIEIAASLEKAEQLIAFSDGDKKAKSDLAAGGLAAAKSFYKQYAESKYPEIKKRAEEGLAAVADAAAKAYEGMVLVKGGEATIGAKGADDTLPEKKTTFRNFYVDKYEVTNALYKKFTDATGQKPPAYWANGRIPPGKENHPVVGVSIEDAKAYATWALKRLPTEEEWEYAARGTKAANYPWGNDDATAAANIDAQGTAEIGSFKKDVSDWGVFDMAGNVSEWTSSKEGTKYVTRGGKFSDMVTPMSVYRFFAPGMPDNQTGFRCVKDAAEDGK